MVGIMDLQAEQIEEIFSVRDSGEWTGRWKEESAAGGEKKSDRQMEERQREQLQQGKQQQGKEDIECPMEAVYGDDDLDPFEKILRSLKFLRHVMREEQAKVEAEEALMRPVTGGDMFAMNLSCGFASPSTNTPNGVQGQGQMMITPPQENAMDVEGTTAQDGSNMMGEV